MLSRLSAESSLERALDKLSGSMPAMLGLSPPRSLLRKLFELRPSTLFMTCSLARSDGGGGVAILEDVCREGLATSCACRFNGGGGTEAKSDSLVMILGRDAGAGANAGTK